MLLLLLLLLLLATRLLLVLWQLWPLPAVAGDDSLHLLSPQAVLGLLLGLLLGLFLQAVLGPPQCLWLGCVLLNPDMKVLQGRGWAVA
jgi:hypothetical protein